LSGATRGKREMKIETMLKEGERAYNIPLSESDISILMVVLAAARKQEWGDKNINEKVSSLSKLFDKLTLGLSHLRKGGTDEK
jgi:hypothetical protein